MHFSPAFTRCHFFCGPVDVHHASAGPLTEQRGKQTAGGRINLSPVRTERSGRAALLSRVSVSGKLRLLLLCLRSNPPRLPGRNFWTHDSPAERRRGRRRAAGAPPALPLLRD
ncbi:hypothetical protein OJAV_G00013250 [Oryzias javanicus]|uniref:Uncharacterized protein n=1 Tax=Oryzias javanicus TaxID=123683 RepID=A0A437DKJ9_ORYJA|nr:hypothetical protein OJAV_G00013250 [Oryzias javanicus]